jgi:cobalt transporter subunit CbtB
MTDNDTIAKAATATRASGLRIDADLQAIVTATLVGAFLLFGAGFANSAAMHSAAHDSRHSIAFPCH